MSSKRKPKLGQNFLSDDAARHRIADALGDLSQRTVIEIGPGHGAITTILAERAKKLICIELDRSLVPELRFKFRNHATVEIIEADILETDLSALISDGKADVIGNLPYYITSDILLHLFAASAHLRTAVVMMQREVADRVAAQPGTRDFGLLSATAQLYGTIDNLFTLPPLAFSPPPEVHSSVLRITFAPRFAELNIKDEQAFIDFLRVCFAQKRKTLLNNLRNAGFSAKQITEVCENAAISPQIRAESLQLESFAFLFRALAADTNFPKK
ncbi:MAG: ribosomal RNA small subunit methyltransferase A [Acidobacteria bacterium]|nr:ribosomal RNA small subunit methyltransferase A [Acidobacteriota bacterium]